MNFGYTGSILHIDLTTKKYWIENPPEQFYRTYYGGRALGLYYMLKEMKIGIDPLSPENLLIFATGILTGDPIPAVPRYTVCSKSPLTGGQGEAEAGGWWGPELKKAGFDALIIKGSSKTPVYLWIKDDKVEIKDATHLWGKDTGITQKIIKEELKDDKVRIAQIGPAGENLVRFANIVNDLIHFNGRCGLGAVMGSKKLKAIAVRGTNSFKVHNQEKLKNIAKKLNQEIKQFPGSMNLKENGTISVLRTYYEAGWLPTKNWTTGYFEGGKNLDADTLNNTILKKRESCYACPIYCKRVVEVNDPEIKVNPLYGGPEYETAVSLGSLCGVDDLKYVSKGNELCNKFTLDTISTGSAIAFAMQCYEKGLLTKKDTGGIELKFGNKKSMLDMIENIAKRRGLGDILAEGTFRAARKIKKGAEKLVHHVKGQEIPMHDPRIRASVGLMYAFADYGADHMKAAHDTLFMHEESRGIKEMEGLGVHESLSLTDISKKKVRFFKIFDIYFSLLDILGVCTHGFVPGGPGTMDELLEIIRCTTGWKTTWYELMKIGERSINMARLYNIREGFTSNEDQIPEVFFQNFNGGPLHGKGAMNRKDFEKAKRLRYQLMGWDEKSGIPTQSKLVDLELDWLVDIIKK